MEEAVDSDKCGIDPITIQTIRNWADSTGRRNTFD